MCIRTSSSMAFSSGCNIFLDFLYLMQAYAELLEEEGIEIPAWFSFNSKDGINVVNGDPISECASIADSCKHVVAVGINCTPPRFIHGLVTSIRKVQFFGFDAHL
jgi:S-methylmethionine-dependent homocysteine/selenocysteine methylase